MYFLQYCRARWVLIDQQIVPDGVFVVASGHSMTPRIVAVADPQRQAIPTPADICRQWGRILPEHPLGRQTCERLSDRDWGDAVVLPGLVNAHTHLEFSDLTTPLLSSPDSFADWIEAVIARRIRVGQGTGDEAWSKRKAEICQRGWHEMRAVGTAAIGEILSSGPVDPRSESVDEWVGGGAPMGVEFHEVLGLSPERARQAWDVALLKLGQPIFAVDAEVGAATSPPTISPRVDSGSGPPGPEAVYGRQDWRPGLSPHAPYSTSTWLYRQSAQLCRRWHLPLATHLAESVEELELLSQRSGPLVRLLQGLGVWQPEQIAPRSVRQVLELVVDVPQLLLIHANYLSPEDWQWLRARNPQASIVYCPQTHAYFQHPRHPWPQMHADGLNVVLGTDSRASSPSLSLWDDLLIARAQHPTQDPRLLWRMATIHGARALGMADRLGTISVGKVARLAIARLPSSASTFSWEALLTPATDCQAINFD
jgi:cytosine/adenosine deaminase-related metal-dependent hydrolase